MKLLDYLVIFNDAFYTLISIIVYGFIFMSITAITSPLFRARVSLHEQFRFRLTASHFHTLLIALTLHHHVYSSNMLNYA